MSNLINDLSSVAYEVVALIEVSRHALDNETSGTPLDQRGIGETLAICQAKAEELLEGVEQAGPNLKKPDI